jgi:hypothetical protein
VRAVDPAGNHDAKMVLGRNEYRWHYTKALPWGLISMGIVLFVLTSSGLYYYYRRRQKLKAMQRFAQKRLRRKMKASARARADRALRRQFTCMRARS